MDFTFYGDLLGISNSYRLSPEAGYRKLDRFYNICFDHLRAVCEGANHAQVNLFSDSIFFWGENASEALTALKHLYLDLVSHDLFLRGAIVQGALQFDPRFTVQNFQKNLPQGDVLPRAVGLSGASKGARLIIERDIAHSVLPSVEWHTIDGYLQSPDTHNDIPSNDIRRFICPVPDGTLYELLYFYSEAPNVPLDYRAVSNRLRNASKMVSKEVSSHYSETIDLIERSRLRINP